MIKNPEEFLLSLIDYEKTGGMVRSLSPFWKALRKLGNPERKVRNPILIAGTKGKGSTALHIAQGLKNAGYRVGLFTSPHLVSFRERIQVNGKPIEDEAFSEILSWVSRILTGRGIRTVFQALTVTAFRYFYEMDVDFSVFEVGLGGRLDSTNVVRQKVTGITRIGYDHTKVLGKTLKEIAREKAGVLKRKIPTFSVRQSWSAKKVLVERAEELGVPLFFLSEDIFYRMISSNLDGSSFYLRFGGEDFELRTPAPGIFQVENAALASSILLFLGIKNPDFTGLKIPGRFEIVRKRPYVILDGAHNLLSIKVLFVSLEKLLPTSKIHLIFGINKDKAIKQILQFLKGRIEHLICTTSNNPRALDPDRLGEMARKVGIKSVSVERDLCKVLSILEKVEKFDAIVVTGSFYLIGEFKQHLFYKTW
jgi:dihydrofolate synthase/folylpolyglutamate synthase